jgi:hypothetical protein
MTMSYSGQRKPSASPLGAGLNEETRKTMNAAFDALSDWRNDIQTTAEKNSAVVFDRMSAAAKAMGWPSDVVDMTRQQMQATNKLQLQMMDQVMDFWEQQMKSPGSPMQAPKTPGFGFPGAFAGMGGAAQSFPSFPGMPSFPGFDLSSMPMMNPVQFWMQAAEMWQKNWQQAMNAWMEAVQSGGMMGPMGGMGWPPGGSGPKR